MKKAVKMKRKINDLTIKKKSLLIPNKRKKNDLQKENEKIKKIIEKVNNEDNEEISSNTFDSQSYGKGKKFEKEKLKKKINQKNIQQIEEENKVAGVESEGDEENGKKENGGEQEIEDHEETENNEDDKIDKENEKNKDNELNEMEQRKENKKERKNNKEKAYEGRKEVCGVVNLNQEEESQKMITVSDEKGKEECDNKEKIKMINKDHNESDDYFSSVLFESLDICEELKKGLRDMNFVKLTKIQEKCIPHLLKGKDILATAKTGSGKTVAFLLPALQMLFEAKFTPKNGTGVLVICPTRELGIQIYEVCRELGKYMYATFGLIIGGANRKTESEKLKKGVNLLVATPGRLLDHMQNTKSFVYSNLASLIIDEGDRILAIGFEEELNMILSLLPKKKQAALFSATQNAKISDLARLNLNKPVFIEVKDSIATVHGLEQGYVLCEPQERFLLLFTFLKRNLNKKIMVFFSSCMSVKFHDELLNYIDIKTSCIHGRKKQTNRMNTFYEFCQAESGILLCTDVAARGLDIPKVDWIVQYDPPDDPREYIHRVGRTARGANACGRALIFLMKEELKFIKYLKVYFNITLNEYVFKKNKISNVQLQLERLIEKNFYLYKSSRDAYRSYMNAYASHSLKDIFNVHTLDLQKVCLAFGFSVPPKIELNTKTKSDRKIKKRNTFASNIKNKNKRFANSGHAFSAQNPYGIRKDNGNRKFC